MGDKDHRAKVIAAGCLLAVVKHSAHYLLSFLSLIQPLKRVNLVPHISCMIKLCINLFSYVIWDPLQRCVWHGWGRIKVCSQSVSKWTQEEQKQWCYRKWGCKLWLPSWKSIQKPIWKEVVYWERDLVKGKQKALKALQAEDNFSKFLWMFMKY